MKHRVSCSLKDVDTDESTGNEKAGPPCKQGGSAMFRYGQILNPAASPGPATTAPVELRAAA